MNKMKKAYPKWLGDEEYKEDVDFALIEGFAHHKAKVVENNDRLLMIDWADKDGGSNNEIHYILDKARGAFIIYGDRGEATACWGHRVELKDLLSYLRSRLYFVEKIQAGNPYEIDIKAGIEAIKKQMEEVKEEYETEGKDTRKLLSDMSCMIELYEEYGEYVYANDAFCDLWDTYSGEPDYDLGKKVSSNVYLWVLGFFMACDDAGLLG